MLCLNIGVDPPDVVKTNPCARKECWIGIVCICITRGALVFLTRSSLYEPTKRPRISWKQSAEAV